MKKHLKDIAFWYGNNSSLIKLLIIAISVLISYGVNFLTHNTLLSILSVPVAMIGISAYLTYK